MHEIKKGLLSYFGKEPNSSGSLNDLLNKISEGNVVYTLASDKKLQEIFKLAIKNQKFADLTLLIQHLQNKSRALSFNCDGIKADTAKLSSVLIDTSNSFDSLQTKLREIRISLINSNTNLTKELTNKIEELENSIQNYHNTGQKILRSVTFGKIGTLPINDLKTEIDILNNEIGKMNKNGLYDQLEKFLAKGPKEHGGFAKHLLRFNQFKLNDNGFESVILAEGLNPENFVSLASEDLNTGNFQRDEKIFKDFINMLDSVTYEQIGSAAKGDKPSLSAILFKSLVGASSFGNLINGAFKADTFRVMNRLGGNADALGNTLTFLALCNTLREKSADEDTKKSVDQQLKDYLQAEQLKQYLEWAASRQNETLDNNGVDEERFIEQREVESQEIAGQSQFYPAEESDILQEDAQSQFDDAQFINNFKLSLPYQLILHNSLYHRSNEKNFGYKDTILEKIFNIYKNFNIEKANIYQAILAVVSQPENIQDYNAVLQNDQDFRDFISNTHFKNPEVFKHYQWLVSFCAVADLFIKNDIPLIRKNKKIQIAADIAQYLCVITVLVSSATILAASSGAFVLPATFNIGTLVFSTNVVFLSSVLTLGVILAVANIVSSVYKAKTEKIHEKFSQSMAAAIQSVPAITNIETVPAMTNVGGGDPIYAEIKKQFKVDGKMYAAIQQNLQELLSDPSIKPLLPVNTEEVLQEANNKFFQQRQRNEEDLCITEDSQNLDSFINGAMGLISHLLSSLIKIAKRPAKPPRTFMNHDDAEKQSNTNKSPSPSTSAHISTAGESPKPNGAEKIVAAHALSSTVNKTDAAQGKRGSDVSIYSFVTIDKIVDGLVQSSTLSLGNNDVETNTNKSPSPSTSAHISTAGESPKPSPRTTNSGTAHNPSAGHETEPDQGKRDSHGSTYSLDTIIKKCDEFYQSQVNSASQGNSYVSSPFPVRKNSPTSLSKSSLSDSAIGDSVLNQSMSESLDGEKQGDSPPVSVSQRTQLFGGRVPGVSKEKIAGFVGSSPKQYQRKSFDNPVLTKEQIEEQIIADRRKRGDPSGFISTAHSSPGSKLSDSVVSSNAEAAMVLNS